MSFVCYGYKLDGTQIDLGVPLSFSFSSSINQAQSQLTVRLKEKPSNLICSFSFYQDGECLFEGFIDWMEHCICETGTYYDLCASSFSSRMMQNQVGPRYLINYSAASLFAEYAQPYGAKVNDLTSATIKEMEVTAGMTAWQVIDLFCRQVYQVLPMLARGDVLTTSIGNRVWTVGGEEHPYTSLIQREDRQDMISQVHYPVNDADQYYTATMPNATAQQNGILRERYWRTPTCWNTMRKQGAAEVVRNSNNKLYSYEVVVPELLSLWPGDSVILQGPIADSSYYVQSFTVQYDEKGAHTKMILWDLVQR